MSTKIVIRVSRDSRDKRKEQQKRAEENMSLLRIEEASSVLFKINRLTGEKYYYGIHI